MSKFIEIPALQITVWEREQEDVRWGASICDAKTKRVFVKAYGETEEDAIGTAGYKFYSQFFHGKTGGQIKQKFKKKA